MLNTTKGKYQKNNTTYTNVASPETSGDSKQIVNIFEDDGIFKYQLEDGEPAKVIEFATNSTNATNVVITNTDTESNANVKFTTGTGTYSKTINNVTNSLNATNATNADNSIKNNDNTYSSLTQNLDNQLRVGNVDNVEVIEKRTLLWKGNPTNSVNLSGFNLQENDEIDIKCLRLAGYDNAMVEYFRLVLSSTEHWHSFTFSSIATSLSQPSLGVHAKDIYYSLSSVYCEEERSMFFHSASQTPGAAVTLDNIQQQDNPAVITEVWKVIK